MIAPMPSSTPHGPTRFLPGAMIANRYRVVALLGRGGMGEVYRADDLKLGEPVALKFLPERLENDESLRERFLGEARLARAVAHPNVCRVYDIGEIEGRLFLSMEYVDGEDLATLLRRIGRLPQEKAVQLARQMCAGLHAAHEQGIVHRDLKPSNVMIDGRGRARITDFGLAAIAEGLGGREATAGTPAYMAPEQLAGREVTVRSDVYALGLVFYELFTGRAAFDAHSWAEQLAVKQSRTPDSPSQLSPGLDPVVERVILRCLQPDPRQRPASAAEVAFALPGGDPLAAALAAGETPSPEMIAEAGGAGTMPRVHAWGWLAALVVGLLAVILAMGRISLLQLAPIEKPPAVLLDRAREIATTLGWTNRPRDEWSVLVYDGREVAELTQRAGRDSVLEHVRRDPGSVFRFAYRRSPALLLPLNGLAWSPSLDDPPATTPGMVSLQLDGRGRLISLEGRPAAYDSATGAAEPDWARLFELAGLDTARFRAVEPRWTPSVYGDRRAAWIGRGASDTTMEWRLEAAAWRGRVVSFHRYPAAMPAPPAEPAGPTLAQVAFPWFVWILFLGLLVLAGFRARRNLRTGQADARGGLRLATAAAVIVLASVALTLHPENDANFIARRFLNAIGHASLLFVVLGSLYLTLEPILRSTWPELLVSWMRLLDGRVRDPRVGRDTMAGLVGGVGLQLLLALGVLAWTAVSHRGLAVNFLENPGAQTDALMGIAPALRVGAGAALAALQIGLSATAFLALFTSLMRRRVPALVLTGVLLVLLQGGFDGGLTGLVAIAAFSLVWLVRFGLVALTVELATLSLLQQSPLVLPGASWYWPTTAVALALMGVLAAWSLRSMLRGRTGAAHAADVLAASRMTGWSAYVPGTPAPAATPSPRSRAKSPAAAPRPETPSQAPTQLALPALSELPTRLPDEPAPPDPGAND